jgi:hypothetical protein
VSFPRRASHVIRILVFAAATTFAQESRVQQAREMGRLEGGAGADFTSSSGGQAPLRSRDSADDGSFGVQQLLREKSPAQSISVFADVSALVTSNVGLTRKNARSDSFLVPIFGLGYGRALPAGLRLEAEVSLAAFRYNSFPKLDFNDLEASIGLSYHAGIFGGLDLYAGYSYTDLSTRSGHSFFQNHAIDLNAQKTIAFSSAQSVFFGVGVELGFADPRLSERSEYSAFAGYRLAATPRWDINVLYRYAYYDYTEGGRGDHNQTISLGTRYRFNNRISAYATSYFTINRSNQSDFNYDVGTLGVGLTLRLAF